MISRAYSLPQERALALIPKFTSSLSIPSSIFIIYEVLTDHKNIGTNTIERVLLGMSIVDVMASSAWFLSTWAVPEGSFAYASGNQASCAFQGFLLQLAIGAPLYNSSLALFYTLMIKQRWTDAQLLFIEKWVHGFIISFTVGTSILLLFLEQYNHVGAVCWVIGSPQDCGHSTFQGSDVPCDRGDYAWLWGLLLFYAPLWICVIACFFSMILLYREVKRTLRRSKNYSRSLGTASSLNRSGRDSNKVAIQAILYSVTFLITWMPSTLWSIAHWFEWSHYGLDVAAATAEPLQGFWNLLIFLRTRPKTVQKIKRFAASWLPCCCNTDDNDSTARESRSRLYMTRSILNVVRAFGPLSDLSTEAAEAVSHRPETTPIRSSVFGESNSKLSLSMGGNANDSSRPGQKETKPATLHDDPNGGKCEEAPNQTTTRDYPLESGEGISQTDNVERLLISTQSVVEDGSDNTHGLKGPDQRSTPDPEHSSDQTLPQQQSLRTSWFVRRLNVEGQGGGPLIEAIWT